MKSRSINFQDEEIFKKLESECYTDTLDFDSFPAVEYKYFSRLRKIYSDYKFGGLDKDTAAKRKAGIYADYRQDAERDGLIGRVYAEYQENIRKAGTLRSDIDKAKTVEDKLRYALECIEAMTGETGFARRNLNALHNEADTTD